ncbi:hypothetical protein EGW08_008924 [Elysia chlorotica]|uniref:GH10 domain-containing protein n=1 Tax=Elysia chlorotica TaxID=188477 RepID=A0A433TNZ6_ELYCH|nr:hypothetical protein EGW08_008924 [Elysia chlorotica]
MRSVTYFAVCSRPNLSAADGWVEIGSDFAVPDREYSEAVLYLQGLSPEVGYYFDDASLKEIPENLNWETEANTRIEQLRKSNLHLSFNIGSNFERKDLMVQLDLSKHQFGFGSLVRAENMIHPDFTQYRNVVYHMFNWATLQDYKWTYNKGNRTNPDYSAAVQATNELLKNGLKVRGHCMFWAVDRHVPSYVYSLSASETRQEIEDHLKYMTSVSKGKLAHWDVNNELVHGNFFERKTNDPDITKYMFKTVHSEDPVPTLFLNEYNVVSKGESTLAYLAQIEDFKNASVGLGAVGVQSHLTDFEEPDTTLMKKSGSTHVNQSLESSDTMDVRGFRGLYDLTVWYKGRPIKHRTLTLGNTDKNLTIGIFGDGSEIQLPVKVDPFASVPNSPDTTSPRLKTLGQASSSSQDSTLTCSNRKSDISAVGIDNFVEVACLDGEVLTGCSSMMVVDHFYFRSNPDQMK